MSSPTYVKKQNLALDFIVQNQNKFEEFSQPHLALIGSVLLSLTCSDKTQTILQNIADFLEENKENFLSRIDQTALAFLVLSKIQKNQASTLSAEFTLQLTRQEKIPGGPYYTTQSNQEIDPVVNAAVHLALQGFGVHLSQLESFLTKGIITNNWRSTTIISAWLNLYLIWRTLSIESKKSLIPNLQEFETLEPITDSLELACKILITENFDLARSGFPDQNNYCVHDIFSKKQESHQAASISGSANVNASLWALIWDKLDKITNPEAVSDFRLSEKNPDTKDAVIQMVARKLSKLEPGLQERGLYSLGQILITPISEEIILLSLDLDSALGANLTKEIHIKLGAANLFGWIAFHLYDNCYEENSPSIELSLANICLRSATTLYCQVSETLKIKPSLVLQTLDSIDEAHAKEVADTIELRQSLLNHERWTGMTVRHIAERSFGHCLGPLLICHSLEPNLGLLGQIKKLFNHYLTARQMCDDLHDWSKDFMSHRVTSVTKTLFFTVQAFTNINVFQAKKIFWNEGLDLQIQQARQEIKLAKQLNESIRWPKHCPTILQNAISRLEESLLQTQAEREAMKSLINTFKV